MNLSDQAMGAIMMALQKSLLEQSDIVPVLKNFNFVLSEEHELNVTNPPHLRLIQIKKLMLLLEAIDAHI